MVFVYLMENLKPLNEELIKAHVCHLKQLDETGKLILCGPFTDYPGGMVIFRAETSDEAKQIAQSDPFIASGYKSYDLRSLELASADNDYLL